MKTSTGKVPSVTHAGDHNDPPSDRNPGIALGIGTGGAAMVTQLQNHENTHVGDNSKMHSEKLVIDTAESTRNLTVPSLDGGSAVALRPDQILILPERRVSDLASMANRSPITRRYAEKLRCVPSYTTRDGAGGNRIVALLALLAALPQVEMALTKCLVAERDRRLFAYRSDQGVRYLTRHVIHVYLAGSGYGSTFSGTVQLIIMLLRRIARLLQLQLVIHVLPTSPSLAVTLDTDHAWGNYGAMMKELLLGQEDPAQIKFHTFTNESIALEPGERFFDSLSPWGRSTGNLTISDRMEAACNIGMLIHYLIHSPLASHSEATFVDLTRAAADRSMGLRIGRELGIARLGVDAPFNLRLGHNAALISILNHILNRNSPENN